MFDENKNDSQNNDNSRNPEENLNAGISEKDISQIDNQGANNENKIEENENNGIPVELQDKYKEFQRDYTEKTTKLSEERKIFESEKETLLNKATTLDKLVSNQKFMQWYNAEVEKENAVIESPKSNIPELTDEIMADSALLSEYLIKRDEAIRSQYDEKISKIDNKIAVQQLTSDIADYGTLTENEDFWKLRDFGLIRDEDIVIAAQKNPRAENLELLEIVHKEAREKYNHIVGAAASKYKVQENETLQRKKNASIDSGRSGNPSSSAPVKQSFEDIMKEEAKKMGISW